MIVQTKPRVPLEFLLSGQTGCIGQLIGSAEEVHRLEELGLRAGRRVEMVQTGSPCIVRIEGQKLCFREAGKFRVLVDLGDPAP